MPKKLKEELEAIVVAPDLASYCPDLATWPRGWCGEERDVIAGEQIVAVFTPFLLDLLAQGLSRKTRNLHRDNLWLLGGEIIRDINETPKLRKRVVGELVREVVANDEGPLIHGGFSEQEQRSFDSTCKKLNRFLAAHVHSKQG
ncbi:hypothetical protein [Rhodoferax antarcticus]|uniref:hypothetical protein n=1 Tax=Rhodoferax antarcticus TaxID=81479 RepID=UPI0022249EE3|nr:hypothetical protein [Rhodoferax antarcticus]MCW2312072.1 hypothetical protein [Rhodoferax antarcticus]